MGDEDLLRVSGFVQQVCIGENLLSTPIGFVSNFHQTKTLSIRRGFLLIQAYIFIAISILAGGYFLIRNINFYRNEAKLKEYLQTSPKGIAWVQKYGMEKSLEHARKMLIPLGCLAGLGLMGVGTWNLLKVLGMFH